MVEDIDVPWRPCFDTKIEHLIEIAIVQPTIPADR